MPESDFRVKLTARITEATNERQALEQQKIDITRQLNAVQKELEELDLVLNVHDRLEGIEPELTALVNPQQFDHGTIADQCEVLLQEMGGIARTRDLVERLTRAGRLRTEYKVAYSAVWKALDRGRRFEKIARGEYALRSSARSSDLVS